MSIPVIIFDIDGTLANCEHRRKYIESKPKNWKKFMDEMVNDPPNEDICQLARILEREYDLVIATGRDEPYRGITEAWLANHSIYYKKLYMRRAKDYSPDNLVKEEILHQIRQDGFEPFLVFDDRDQVVKMWRDNGLRCLQVGFGDF